MTKNQKEPIERWRTLQLANMTIDLDNVIRAFLCNYCKCQKNAAISKGSLHSLYYYSPAK